MKTLYILLALILLPVIGHAQEFKDYSISMERLEIPPGLSLLAPPLPSQRLTLTEINWNKEVKREVNLSAIMEKARYEKEQSYVDLGFDAPTIGRSEKKMIEVTNDLYIHERGSNYDIYTGEKKNPAYKEMRAGLFMRNYNAPFHGNGYAAPNLYSSFLR
jgi:hypothetical protein